MQIAKTLYVTNRDDWRAWLDKHHDGEQEVWLVFYRKHTGKPSIPYDEAVEEALCFGWIDSIVKRIDDRRYAQKFTPRRPGSNWSELNKQRLRKLMREGRVTEAGLAKVQGITNPGAQRPATRSPDKTFRVPPGIAKALRADQRAWENFSRFAPGYRKLAVRWISAAKKQETRERRLREVISLAKQNKKIGLK